VAPQRAYLTAMEAQQTCSDLAPSPTMASAPRLRPALIDPATTRHVQERLGRAIRLRRRMLDLTLQDLAGACGVTFQQVHKYESGLCSLSASQLWAIAQALNVPVAYFYENLEAPDVWRADGAQVA
jgi:DNA-binding XRE family transcriptional regulator